MSEGRSVHPRADGDWYVEPAWTVEALLDAVDFGAGAYDPACGAGTIPDVLKARHLPTWGSDVVDRAGGRFKVRDFLRQPERTRPTWPAIITNPPYRDLEAFVARGLEEVLPGGRVAVLAPLKWAASQERYALFTRPEMERVLVLSRRPSIPPGEFLKAGGKASGGSIDFAWFVFQRGRNDLGPPTIGWLK